MKVTWPIGFLQSFGVLNLVAPAEHWALIPQLTPSGRLASSLSQKELDDLKANIAILNGSISKKLRATAKFAEKVEKDGRTRRGQRSLAK